MSLVSTDPPLPKKSSLEKSFSHCTSFSFWSRQKLPLSHNEQKSTQYNLIKLLTNNLKILTLSGLHAVWQDNHAYFTIVLLVTKTAWFGQKFGRKGADRCWVSLVLFVLGSKNLDTFRSGFRLLLLHKMCKNNRNSKRLWSEDPWPYPLI